MKRLSGVERRLQLMQVARGVFAKHGYEATALEDIAARAGVSKPIVYEHYGSKEGLYAAIVEHEMDDLVSRISRSIGSGKPRERFEAAVLAFMTYAKEEPAGFAVLSRDSSTGAARKGMTRVIDDVANRVGAVFRDELTKAGYSAKTAPIYSHALVGMVTQVGQWWAAEGRGFSIEQVARLISTLGWLGLRHLPREKRKRKRTGK